MPFQRMTALFLLAFAAMQGSEAVAAPSAVDVRPWQLESASAIASTPWPASGQWLVDSPATTDAAPAQPKAAPTGLRRLLADFSMTLQNIRYRRGGRDPKTGFDCSGFVRYVFRHSAGVDLPVDSASQYRAGINVARADLKVGDLVFFKTRGKRVSHVGIYLGEGRFIHSPSTGKSVSISRLDESYWTRRYVGAKRPDVLS
ncbi:C40 family peptidase [Dokdonella fugitiva]|uniref:Cell wall-associated NlpC family hydrolase n=1 Tax=Dokdonella fugitiva TaxID=328517 RepID=A0A4R2IFI1_9GAMM|nr:C40 family peptidase [Dokdonella fugitiva]MBA8883703.1 cell wall-associated NlpC family hydrolase [Dokdonella fugitiva]TCO41445.1 cell wall-associated NlpC family hydrolase [Dokdonella fugitiva]